MSEIPLRLQQALVDFMRNRKKSRPVSIAALMKSTRYAMPDLEMSDEELAQAIAGEVIKHGGSVEFDRRAAARKAFELD